MNKPKVKFIRTHTSSIYRMVDASNPQIQFGVISYEPISGVWQSKSCNPAFDYHINECEDFYDAFWHIDDVKEMANREEFRFIPEK